MSSGGRRRNSSCSEAGILNIISLESPESDNYELEVRYDAGRKLLDVQMRRYDWEYGEYTETDYMLSLPLWASPLARKSLGAVSGRVFYPGGRAVPIPGAVVTLNGSKAAANASGGVFLTAPPGRIFKHRPRFEARGQPQRNSREGGRGTQQDHICRVAHSELSQF